MTATFGLAFANARGMHCDNYPDGETIREAAAAGSTFTFNGQTIQGKNHIVVVDDGRAMEFLATSAGSVEVGELLRQ